MYISIRRLTARAWNSAIMWTVAVTFMRAVGFFAVTTYALRKLPPVDMGLWYVMLSAIELSVMVEMGLTNTIGRFTSYFNGGAEGVPAIGLPPASRSRGPNYPALAGLVTMARPLYAVLGLAASTMTLLIGLFWWMSGRADEGVGRIHVAAFLLLAFGAGFNMARMFWLGMLYGIGRVRLYNQLYMLGMLLNYILAFVGLLCGAGLAALACGQIVLNYFPRTMARRYIRRHIPEHSFEHPKPQSWRNLWPVTWRAGLASFSSYLAIQSTTIVCGFVSGLETAASYGLTMQLAIMLYILSAAWMWVKYPEISTLRSQGRIGAIYNLLRVRMPLCVATFVSGAFACTVLVPPLLHLVGSQTQTLPLAQFIGVFVLLGMDLIVGMHAALIQTANSVPHLRVFLVSGVVTLGAAALFGSLFGVWGILLSAFTVQALCKYWYTPVLAWSRLRAAR